MNNFKHIQSAHCENGVTSSLFQHYGVSGVTEPLAFGIGAGLFYIHIPYMKINGGPAMSFRTFPGAIFKRNCNYLDIPIYKKKFKSEESAMDHLDNLLEEGHITGCQVGVYNLPYFPVKYRFHFNAHNIIIYGKENGRYLVSDPTMEITTSLSREELKTVRFAKGALAPKGHLYGPKDIIKQDVDLSYAIKKGIKRNSRDMLHIPGPVAGVAGIGYTGKKISKWKEQLGDRKAALYLGQIIRMQEEIGTGGGGFRFIYAAFLEQAHQYIKNDDLLILSNEFTQSGDLWRNSAVAMAQIVKGKKNAQADFDDIHERFKQIQSIEKNAFQKLSKLDLG